MTCICVIMGFLQVKRKKNLNVFNSLLDKLIVIVIALIVVCIDIYIYIYLFIIIYIYFLQCMQQLILLCYQNKFSLLDHKKIVQLQYLHQTCRSPVVVLQTAV